MLPSFLEHKKRTGFGSHPKGSKTQARCGWDAGPHDNFPLAVTGDARGTDGRLKKRTGFGSHPGRQKLKPDAAGTQAPHNNFPLAVAGVQVAPTDD
jgi:hypothetical protein